MVTAVSGTADTVRLVLQRVLSDEEGTVGVLFHDGEALALTIELPWRWNVRQISCIQAGIYPMLWTRSPRLRRFTYELRGVPGRDGIRIHSGNFAGDKIRGFDSHSLGCPLLGERLGALTNSAGRRQRAVVASVIATRRVEDYLAGRPCTLEVCDAA
jgi:hypothetical protein